MLALNNVPGEGSEPEPNQYVILEAGTVPNCTICCNDTEVCRKAAK